MEKIQVGVVIKSSLENVWKSWNTPESIRSWAFASDDWECPHAENDLRVGGKFLMRMSAKDKSASFDFIGTYTEVEELKRIQYVMDTMGDEAARICEVTFEDLGSGEIKVVETFDPEHINSADRQREGWQSILNNFKKFVESK